MEQDQQTTEFLETASEPFIGEWRKLISTSNWEKGRIILEWRCALIETGAPATEYSDESWAQRVGGVTGQHTGRLRRVFEQFHDSREQYSDLYWSHFQAALDWDDAEMWLEGASQNAWSVSAMRRQRWETLGAIEANEPSDRDIIESEIDEDYSEPESIEKPKVRKDDRDSNSDSNFSSAANPEGPDFGEDAKSPRTKGTDGAEVYSNDQASVAFVRPFENLGELPEDITDAFESFKLAILRHKGDGWEQVSQDDVLASLDALKELALAPSADASSDPF